MEKTFLTQDVIKEIKKSLTEDELKTWEEHGSWIGFEAQKLYNRFGYSLPKSYNILVSQVISKGHYENGKCYCRGPGKYVPVCKIIVSQKI